MCYSRNTVLMTSGFALGQSALYFCCSTPGQDITNTCKTHKIHKSPNGPIKIFANVSCYWICTPLPCTYCMYLQKLPCTESVLPRSVWTLTECTCPVQPLLLSSAHAYKQSHAHIFDDATVYDTGCNQYTPPVRLIQCTG